MDNDSHNNNDKIFEKCEICDQMFENGQESKQHFIQFHHGIIINI